MEHRFGTGVKVGDKCFSFSPGYGSCDQRPPEGCDIPYRAGASRSYRERSDGGIHELGL